MPATQAALPAPPSLVKTEMEDRKRSLLTDGEDLAPNRKRLKDENGASVRMSDEQKEKDIEDFQKDAIFRQMKEYKRQKKDADDQLAELHKKTKYHNDHLRTIDAWFAQLLDEVRVLASESLSASSPNATSTNGEELYNSALLFEDNATFSEHLKIRSKGIKGAITDLFGRIPSASPEVENMRKQLNDLLAKEKSHTVELKKALDEKDSLYERLEQAMGRYMTAERKLDRAKSTQVLKLEKQAIVGNNVDVHSPTNAKAATTPKREHTETNGDFESGMASAEAETARKEALVAAEKSKAQLEEIETENERLTNELSAARTKLVSLTDDDYAETSLCRTLKSQYEDVVKRINDLETTNIQLREDAKRLHAERIAYRTQIDNENRSQTSEIEIANARAETDLSRIRHARDQLTTEIAILKASDDNNRTSVDQARELTAARDSRIAALESQVERLKQQIGESEAALGDFDGLDADTLKNKLRTVDSQYTLLSNELASMEAAWKKAQALASKKIDEVAGWEEQIGRLSAEKAKADQKYFAAMKAKDMREIEVRTLKAQNARSSEIISQLKEGDAKSREFSTNLERQLTEAKEGVVKLEQQYLVLDQKLKDSTISADGLRKSVSELKTLVSAKDKDNLAVAKAKRDAEENLEKCKARLDETKRQYDTLRKSKASQSGQDSDDWRKVAICPVCNQHIRNTVLKLCGHVFCQECVKDLISNRSRKCPSCGKGFGSNDQMGIVLT